MTDGCLLHPQCTIDAGHLSVQMIVLNDSEEGPGIQSDQQPALGKGTVASQLS
ncbi:hypothetical protein [Paracoccus sp. Ld10]|uniref:hypothetical protein n=1 Tax=Paracoccus sp. Ld10 TaxID=649158 RepID=UPI003869BD73